MSNEVFARTAATEHVTNLTWKIENFLDEKLWRQNNSIIGPDVMIRTQPQTLWNTFIDRQVPGYNTGNYLGQQLFTYNTGKNYSYIFRAQPLDSLKLGKDCQIEYELTFQDKKNKCIWKCNRTVEKKISEEFANMSKMKHVSFDTLSMLLVDKDLNLKCCFKVVQCSTISNLKTEAIWENDLSSLSDNFRTMYLSKKLSDFTIVVNNKKFSVHKLILSSRSPVFAAMFKNHTFESQSDKVVVKDFDTKTVEIFILYIYTGKLSELTVEEYLKLYSISDKYGVVSLNKTCTQKLINCMSVDNVCDVYAFGYHHNNAVLKSAAKTYINKNASSVLLSENWRKITSQNMEVASEILKGCF